MSQLVEQAVVVTQTSLNRNRAATQLALFKADGTPKVLANPATAQVDSVATDVAGLKADFNALLAKLRAAGVVLP